MGDYLRFKSSLPPRLSEFVILLTARRWTQQYEWNAHAPLAVKGGLSPDIVKAIAEGRRPGTDGGRRGRSSTRCSTRSSATQAVSDGTYGRAVGKIGEQGVIDVMGITGYYTMLAMVMNTARTPLPDGAEAGARAAAAVNDDQRRDCRTRQRNRICSRIQRDSAF